jgi:Thioesterase-like superfamily
MVTAYFQRLSPDRFRATPAVQGAWNTEEQHIGPALGLLTHSVETDRNSRRDDQLDLTRLSFDILGTVPIDEVEIDVQVLRPGRSIELVGATLSHRNRIAVILRAWLPITGCARAYRSWTMSPSAPRSPPSASST